MIIKSRLDSILKVYSKNYDPKLFFDKDVFAEWLAQTYYFVRHSTSLLGHALPHLKSDELRHHFEHHLAEEKHHDLLALKDLERLGHDIKSFQENFHTQAFYQSQYYRISFQGGTSLLGYILFLEGLAVVWGKSLYDELKDVHKNSMLFLKVHAEEDPHHLESAIETIMKLSAGERELILKNLEYSHHLYEEIIQDALLRRGNKQVA